MPPQALTDLLAVGWKLLPLTWIDDGGMCSCGRSDCPSPAKHPLTGTGVYGASDDPEQIDRWIRSWPRCSWGVATGDASGVVVVDLDGAEGEAFFANFCARHGEPSSGPVALTGSGGRHYYFSAPASGWPKNKVRIRPGCDIRSSGGYVVAPPSLHLSGRRYSWVAPPGPGANPEWLERLLAEKPAERPRAASPAVRRTTAYGRAALDGIAAEMAQAQPGSRNDALNAAAFRLGRLVVADLVDEAEAVAALDAAGDQAGLGAHERERTISSGLSAGVAAGPVLLAAPPAKVEPEPPPEWVTEEIPLPESRHRPLGEEEELPEISVTNRQDREIIGDAWNAIITENDPPTMFRRGFTVSYMGENNSLELAKPGWMQLRLGRVANWVEKKAAGRGPDKEIVAIPTGVPRALLPAIMAEADLRLPVVDAVVSCPTVGADGSLLTTPGYHPSSRIYYVDPGDLDIGEVPQAPTDEDVAYAREMIVDQVLGEFPFASQAGRAAAVAAILTPLVRRLITDGCVPPILAEASTPRTGKTFLTQVASTIVLGSSCPMSSVPLQNDEECAKAFLSILLAAPSIVVLDNLPQKISSPILANVLTSESFSSRLLGESRSPSVPVRCIIWMTANNPKLSTELAERTVRIRLNALLERPGERKFSRPNLLAWVREHRGEIIRALLTLVRNWLAKGRPPAPEEPFFASYQGWTRTMCGILHAAGIPGLLCEHKDDCEEVDEDRAEWSEFVGVWWRKNGDAAVTVRELWEIADPGEHSGKSYLADTLTAPNERGRLSQMGRAMQRQRDCVYGNWTVKGARNNTTKAWTFSLVSSAPEDQKPF
jgi:hypothetical protein